MIRIFCAASLFGSLALLAQGPPPKGKAPAPDPKTVQLAGDRFRPLKYDEMTPEQKTMITNVVTGPRRGAAGPFNVLLRSPEMGDMAQKWGAELRFNSGLPDKLRELAIMITVRHWNVQYEWQAHRRAAEQAGLSAAISKSVAEGKRPAGMSAEEEVVYNFCHELIETGQVSDANFNAAIKAFGERKVVNMMGLMGYYTTVAFMMNVDRYPLPEGQKPELKPLK
jgi:4-carboxymuconolactone decarboxylase